MNHSYANALKACQNVADHEMTDSKLKETLLPPIFQNGRYDSIQFVPQTQAFELEAIKKSNDVL